jgi:hypothetical protein
MRKHTRKERPLRLSAYWSGWHLGNQETVAAVRYNPNFPAEFSRKRLPSRMYRLTICTDLCPV